jgi:hypothetical protein
MKIRWAALSGNEVLTKIKVRDIPVSNPAVAGTKMLIEG